MRDTSRRLRVLVADANRLFQAVARSWLEAHEAIGSVRVECLGEQVLEALDETTFDLVLVDGTLPDMDGFELTRRIKMRADAPLVVILVLFDFGAVRREAGRAGADACLDKGTFTKSLDPLLRDLGTRRGSLGPPNRAN